MVRSADGGMIIKQPKTESSCRDVVYPDFVIDRLSGCRGRLVKMHPEDISKKWQSVLAAAGVPRFRFHDLRAYSASIMHALGIPDQYIMTRGGWKSDRVLKQVYRRSMSDKEKEFTDVLNQHFEEMHMSHNTSQKRKNP